MTDLCKSILLEQSQFAKLYAGTLNKSAMPKRARKLERGLFGIVKGDTITYQDPNGTVTTKKLSEV